MAQVIDLKNPNAIPIAVDKLKSGKVIVGPTDTIYGMFADASNEDAVAQLITMKKRQPDHALPLIASDLEQVERYCEISEIERKIAAAFWPGPLTLVLHRRAAAKISRACVENNTIAVRVPASEFNREIARALGRLITATSTNISGEPPADSVASVSSAIQNAVSCIFDAGPSVESKPTTIIRIVDNQIRVLRQGPVSQEEILVKTGLNL
ncbi:threonylcarbamoyl-AMP synthase [candidate division KSB1 bacterium]|nr:threonylcarbamoyl-AMP synthase [candidate division KSB1 bacterium]